MASAVLAADHVAELSDNLSALLRTLKRTHTRLVGGRDDQVEISAYPLIAWAVKDGPLRISALAERVQSDVSTVSRQVAVLVTGGLLERQADPVDRRASLVVATDRARELHEEHVRRRHELVARVLADWTPDECQTFSAAVARFTADFTHRSFVASDGSAVLGCAAHAETEEP